MYVYILISLLRETLFFNGTPSPLPIHEPHPPMHSKHPHTPSPSLMVLRRSAFIGGVILLQSAHYRQLNGMPTSYWGWYHCVPTFLARHWSSNLTLP